MEKCNVGEFIMFTCAQTLSPSLSSVATVNQLVRHVFALALLTSATERSQCIRKHNDLNRVETPLDTQHSNNRYDSATLSAISPPCITYPREHRTCAIAEYFERFHIAQPYSCTFRGHSNHSAHRIIGLRYTLCWNVYLLFFPPDSWWDACERRLNEWNLERAAWSMSKRVRGERVFGGELVVHMRSTIHFILNSTQLTLSRWLATLAHSLRCFGTWFHTAGRYKNIHILCW